MGGPIRAAPGVPSCHKLHENDPHGHAPFATTHGPARNENGSFYPLKNFNQTKVRANGPILVPKAWQATWALGTKTHPPDFSALDMS